MTLKQFIDKVGIGPCRYGKFVVTIKYRNENLRCSSNNTIAYDTICNYLRYNYYPQEALMTPKQAYQQLWDECLRVNRVNGN